MIELPGRVEAVRSAEVRTRVDGIVERQLFVDGSDVAAGAPLFLIDPRDMTASRKQAQARLDSAQVARANAKSVADRFKPLVARRAISAQEYEAALASLQQADAAVSEARAAADRAQLQLSFTTVRAPIAGRAGRALVSEGSLVSAGQGTLLARVDQLSPLFVTFTQSSIEQMGLLQDIQAGRIRFGGGRQVPVRLIKENGEDYNIVGHLDFAGQSVDPSTGAQTLRARFANPQRRLLPGQFVRGVINAGTIVNGIAVPERAVQINGEAASVMTVGADSTVARRVVTLAGQTGNQWIVRSGLKPGERLIVEGWHKVQPGQKVNAVPLTAPAVPTS